MKNTLKSAVLQIPFVRRATAFVKRSPQPPEHAIKQAAILHLAREHGAKYFVESGTFRGDMINAMAKHFTFLYSIELNPDFCATARIRFAHEPNIEIIEGDSGHQISEILPRLDGPALFWLDGHYSGGDTARGECDTPIWAELHQILSAADHGHVIMIDDARLFGRDRSYPTVGAVLAFVANRRPLLRATIANDAIIFTPPRMQQPSLP